MQDAIWVTILLNIFCSVLGSLIFLFCILYSLRPRISISDYISKQKNQFEGDSEFMYVFKIINKSKFSAFDIQLELFTLEQYRVSTNGINNRIKGLELRLNEIKHIPPFRNTKSCKKTSFAPHAVLFRTNENLEEIIKHENKTIQLQITLKHGLTGLSRVYQKDYIDLDCIKSGQFKFGNSVSI